MNNINLNIIFDKNYDNKIQKILNEVEDILGLFGIEKISPFTQGYIIGLARFSYSRCLVDLVNELTSNKNIRKGVK